MKRKTRRTLERQAEAVRRESSTFPIDLQKLLALDGVRSEILKAAEVADKQGRKGGGRELQ